MSSVLGKISGEMLEQNLMRNGSDLSFSNTVNDDPVLFLDVNTNRIGLNKNFADSSFDVNGDLVSENLNTDFLQLSTLEITANNLTTYETTLNITASSSVNLSSLGTDQLIISNNAITITSENQNLEITPDGSGTVEFLSNSRVQANADISGDITVNGNIIFGNDTGDTIDFNSELTSSLIPETEDLYNFGSGSLKWLSVYSPETFVSDSQIHSFNDGETVTLRAKNSEYDVVIENITISVSSLENSSGNFTIAPTETFDIQNNTALKVPVGTTAQRITGTQVVFDGGNSYSSYTETISTLDASNDVDYTDLVYHGGKAVNDPVMNDADLRYNTTYNLYEAYSEFGVISFGSVYSDDKITKISTEESGNAINFIIDQKNITTVDADGFDSAKMNASGVLFENNTISSSENVSFVTSGTGAFVYDDLQIKDNLIQNSSGSLLEISNTSSGYVKIHGTFGVVVPYGDSDSRPDSPQIGDTRYSTESGLLETFTGTTYADSWGPANAITAQEMQDIVDAYSLIFV